MTTPNNNDAPTSRRLPPEELAKRYAELRRRQAFSPTTAFSRDPDKVLGWAYKGAGGQDIAFHRYWGYEILHEKMTVPREQRLVDAMIEPKADGTYECGDVILMVIDKYLYDYLQEQNSKRSIHAMSAGKENFVANAARIEVPTFNREKAKLG